MLFKGCFSSDEIEVIDFYLDIMNVERMKIELLDGAFEHFFLQIRDSQGVLRGVLTYKSRNRIFYLGELLGDCSPSTLSGEILNGKWQFTIIKPYGITGEFSFSVNFINKGNLDIARKKMQREKSGYAWYRGDLHIHSYYSDGRISYEQIFQEASKKNLDFIALSDHSVFPTVVSENKITFIPATEITLDDSGHYNILGINTLIDYSQYFRNEKIKDNIVNKIVADQLKLNRVITLNHPFHKKTGITHNVNLQNYNLIEVINSPYNIKSEFEHNYNREAVDFFDYLWLKRIKLWGVGGSDSHKEIHGEIPIGSPTTSIYSSKCSVDELLNSLKNGRVFITDSVNAIFTFTDTNGKIILPGDDLGKGESFFKSNISEIDFKLTVDKEIELIILKNGKINKKVTGREFRERLSINNGDFFRIEGQICKKTVLFINPIYKNIKDLREESDNFISWLELKKNFIKERL